MMLDVAERAIVIVGGGAVACRKAIGLIDAGAQQVRAVAPAFDVAMPDGVQRVTQRYQPAHLDGAQLVFAATDDPTVNEAVVHDARARGLLVCRADSDDDEPGDFATPAKFQSGGVCVTVSASGNPALAVLIRDHLLREFNPHWGRLAGAMATLRPMVLSCVHDPEQRRAIFRDLATNQAVDVLAEHGADALLAWIRSRHPLFRAMS
jgi:precorrin-2 dehydrogenase/sirohydrochlorin ferrochelatase